MECQELAPVLSRVGSALQYRKDRLTSPLSIMPSTLCSSASNCKKNAQRCWTLVMWLLVRVKTESVIGTLWYDAILQCHSRPTGGVFVASKPLSCKKWSEWLWKTEFLEVSSNHCSRNDWFSMEMFHSVLFIVRTRLKSAGLKCGAKQTTS